MCEDMNIALLAKVPLEPKLLLSCEGGKAYVKEAAGSETAKQL